MRFTLYSVKTDPPVGRTEVDDASSTLFALRKRKCKRNGQAYNFARMACSGLPKFILISIALMKNNPGIVKMMLM